MEAQELFKSLKKQEKEFYQQRITKLFAQF